MSTDAPLCRCKWGIDAPAPESLAREVVRARTRADLAALDYARSLREWLDAGASWREVSHQLGLHEHQIAETMSSQPADVVLLPGFCGATPMEICQRYSVGQISREQLVDELVRFPYVKVERDPYDDVTADPPGAWSEVEHAQGLGHIDIDLYDEVFRRRHPDWTDGSSKQQVHDEQGA